MYHFLKKNKKKTTFIVVTTNVIGKSGRHITLVVATTDVKSHILHQFQLTIDIIYII